MRGILNGLTLSVLVLAGCGGSHGGRGGGSVALSGATAPTATQGSGTMGGGGSSGGGSTGGGSTTTSTGTGRIRGALFSPDAPSVALIVDGQLIPGSYQFGESSAYYSIGAGTHELKGQVTGGSQIVFDFSVTVTAGNDFSVLAADKAANITEILFQDDNTAPPTGFAKFRGIHAAPSAGAVDLYVTGPTDSLPATPTAANLTYKQATNYIMLAAGTYRARVTNAGTTNVIADSGAVPLSGGQIRTAVASDAPMGGQIVEWTLDN
jgi:hypothetical protein